DVQVNVPTAATRSDHGYAQFCTRIVQEASPEVLRKIGIQHNHWIVYEEDDGSTSLNQATFSQPSSEAIGNDPGIARESSKSFPRALNPTQVINSDTSHKLYDSIVLREISQGRNPQHDEVTSIIMSKFDGSENLDGEDGYVTMKPNVLTQQLVYEEFMRTKVVNTNIPPQSTVYGNYSPMAPHFSKEMTKEYAAGTAPGYGQLKNRPKHPLPSSTGSTKVAKDTPDSPEPKIYQHGKSYELVHPLKVNADRLQNITKAGKTPAKLEFSARDMGDWSLKDVAEFLKVINLEQMLRFVNDIEWSSERYKLDDFLKKFPLPQVVKVRTGLPSSSSRGKRRIAFDETLVLHSFREIEIIRATDSIKNEFFLPKDTTADVEVIWKNYKTFYDHVEELCEDFPAHVLVMQDDQSLGIQKGDVLKLKQEISSRQSKYLECAVVDRVHQEVNIPFGYKGLFKTLGDLTQEHVLLHDAIQHCKLPRVVKFIDNKLKMKRVDGRSSQPGLALCKQGEVTLHEVISYADVIACKMVLERNAKPGICVMTISLDSGIEVLAPTATSRSDPSYSNLCTSIHKTVSEDMASKLAIQHSHWIVYEVETNDHHYGNMRHLESTLPSRKSLPNVTTERVRQRFDVQGIQERVVF
ncbi:hypothetical protein QZH41_012887, partial [Actinostola sp. cb2023]